VLDTAAADINPDGDTPVSSFVVRFALDKQFDFGQRCLMAFPKEPRRLVPEKVAVWAIHVSTNEGRPAFAMSSELVDPRATLAAFSRVRMQPAKNPVRVLFANAAAVRIDARKQGGQTT
jgi:hypothetical protein